MITGKVKKVEGSALLELSIVLPVLLIIIAGIIQFGFILNAKVAVNSAAYEAAREATLASDPSKAAVDSAQNYASATLPGWSYGDRLHTSVDLTGTDPGDLVKVEVTYKIPVFFAKFLSFSDEEGSYLNITGSSVMSIEEKA
ncbi:MAG: TadE/TadG family type IV pilus assembly protein [Actinomycetota bacterium]